MITKQQWFEANAYGKECLFDELLTLNTDLLAALKAVDRSFGSRLEATLTQDEIDALRLARTFKL